MDNSANEVKIVSATVEHIRILVKTLREEDLREIDKFGVTPFKGIWRSYKESKVCKAGFLGDRIVAIWGISGGLLGFQGNPWLFTSTVVDECPFVFASIYRQEMRKMLKQYRTLSCWCDISYVKSLKMLRIVGFREKEVQPCGKNGALLVRLEMVPA